MGGRGLEQLGAAALPWVLLLLLWAAAAPPGEAFTFTIQKEECFTYHMDDPDEYLVVGFVVTKYEGFWHEGDQEHTVDLKVTDPHGHEVASAHHKSQDDVSFWTSEVGDYKVCFHNNVQQAGQVALDVITGTDWHKKDGERATDEHVNDVKQQIRTLNHDLQMAHHEVWYAFYLAMQHKDVDQRIGKRLLQKTFLQAILLIACGAAQVYFLRRLFEKRVRQSKV